MAEMRRVTEDAPRSGARPDRQRAARRAVLWRVVLLCVGVGVATFVAYRLGLTGGESTARRVAELVRRARDHPLAVPTFVAGYALVTSLGIPGFAFTLAGGVIFGLAQGTLLSWLGGTLGAFGAYVLARAVGGDAMRRLLRSHNGLVERLSDDGTFAAVLRLRLLPVVPFNLINFACGLARIPFRTYAAATVLGVLPGTLIITYFADSVLAGAEGARRRAMVHTAFATVLLLALSFAPRLFRPRD
jgi:uncharacterized membrane protein YdjX (TVP38/TMEM64 family)